MDNTILADEKSFIPAHRRGIGLVSQHGALFPHLSVADNIGFGLDRGARPAGPHPGADGHGGARSQHAGSGGRMICPAANSNAWRRRARFPARPRLMLLDEPSFRARRRLARGHAKIGFPRAGPGRDHHRPGHPRQAEALSFERPGHGAARRTRGAGRSARPELYFCRSDPETASFLGDAIVLPATLGDNFADCALGRVLADTAGQHGTGDIMLRPEQLRLSAAVAGQQAPPARVTAVEFGGSSCVVAVRLDGSDKLLTFRMSAFDAPEVGAGVQISVVGKAHIFAGPKA